MHWHHVLSINYGPENLPFVRRSITNLSQMQNVQTSHPSHKPNLNFSRKQTLCSVVPRQLFPLHLVLSIPHLGGLTGPITSLINMFLMSTRLVLILPFSTMNVACFPHVWLRMTVFNFPFVIKQYRSVLSLDLHWPRVYLLLLLYNRASKWCSYIILTFATLSGSIWIFTLCNLTVTALV